MEALFGEECQSHHHKADRGGQFRTQPLEDRDDPCDFRVSTGSCVGLVKNVVQL